jgi:hypothetical protein
MEDVRLNAEIGPNDYLENLEFAVMVAGEARKGNWSVVTDLIYMDLGNQGTRVRHITGPDGRALADIGLSTEFNFSATVWTLAGAYTVARGPMGNLDVLAGFRYAGIETDLEWDLRGSRN